MKKKIIPISLIIIFSIVLWGSVSLSEDYITTIKVPVQLIDLPKNYTAGYISEKEIYLRIKSKGWELAKVELGGDFEFNVSAHRKIGRFKVDLRNDIQNNNWLTSTFQVLEIVPAQVECVVDKKVSKRVAIAGNYSIDFKDNYGSASDVQLSPDSVTVTGPVSILEKLDTIKTEFRNFTNVSDPVNEEIPLEKIEGLEYSIDKCSLQFDVQKIVDRAFEGLVVEIRNLPSSKELVLYPSKITVVLKGGINKLGKLTSSDIKTYVDYYAVMRNDPDPVEPVVEIPSFTTHVDVKPKKLDYVIKQY